MSRISNQEGEVRKLIKDAESYVEADELKKAGEKLHQAIRKAEDMGNKELLKQIMDVIEVFTYTTKTQTVKLSPIETDGFILDIGGGGEGIVGKLNGGQVVAIDIKKRELLETQNEALKVIMDATELKFLPKSIDICTSFFSIMYIQKNRHLKVFEEVHRVLKNNGRFLLWEVKIPERFGNFKAFMVRLKVKLPNEEIDAGYGVKWHTQDMEYYKDIAEKARFKVVCERSNEEIFHLEMRRT